LQAGKEGMAGRADLNPDVFDGRTGFQDAPACTTDVGFLIRRMDVSFHRIPFLISLKQQG
jgi:hypothetical protein